MKGNLFYYLFSVVRIFLYPIALLYGAIVWLRNKLYNIGFFSSIEFSLPVITVGNLSTGGTGKTPHVEYLVRLLQYQYKVATMSRGYKRHSQGFLIAGQQANALSIGDEPMQYFLKFPDLVVCVAEERMTGIPMLLQKRPDIDLIILDDAYQHRSVKAGLNILITDYFHPFYKDHVLPFGSLREGREASKRADIIIVSKCSPNLSIEEANIFTKSVNLLSHQQIFFTTILYDKPYNLITKEPFEIENNNLLLVCGIARPQPLVDYLKTIALNVHSLTFADHHYFGTADLEEIKATFDGWNVENKIIITTEKDAARLMLWAQKLEQLGLTILVLPIIITVLFNKTEDFNNTIIKYAETAIANNTINN